MAATCRSIWMTSSRPDRRTLVSLSEIVVKGPHCGSWLSSVRDAGVN